MSVMSIMPIMSGLGFPSQVFSIHPWYEAWCETGPKAAGTHAKVPGPARPGLAEVSSELLPPVVPQCSSLLLVRMRAHAHTHAAAVAAGSLY